MIAVVVDISLIIYKQIIIRRTAAVKPQFSCFAHNDPTVGKSVLLSLTPCVTGRLTFRNGYGPITSYLAHVQSLDNVGSILQPEYAMQQYIPSINDDSLSRFASHLPLCCFLYPKGTAQAIPRITRVGHVLAMLAYNAVTRGSIELFR